jgi:hypothetical protein
MGVSLSLLGQGSPRALQVDSAAPTATFTDEDGRYDDQDGIDI